MVKDMAERFCKSLKNNKLHFILLALLIINLSCDEIISPKKTDEIKWEYGAEKSYTVSGNQSVTIKDSLTGLTFNLPHGGNGTLKITKITNGPSLDYPNLIRFALEYSGNDTVILVLDHKSDDFDLAFFHGNYGGIAIDSTKNPTWWGVKDFIENNGKIIYYLNFKINNPTKTTSKNNDNFLTVEAIKHFAVSNVPNGSPENVMMKAIKTTVKQCVDKWLENLPPDLYTKANSLVKGSLRYSISWSSSNAYSHGNSMFFSNATFSLKRDAGISAISHEVGHYMNHVLCGYDRYNEIVNRMPSMILWGLKDHAPFSYRPGRHDQLEEPAMLSEYMCMKEFFGCNFELDKPNDVIPFSNLKNIFPEDVDYPSHEVFGVYVLVALMKNTNQIYPFDYYYRDYKKVPMTKVPVVGASWQDILRIISKGSRDINELIVNIQNYLDERGNEDRFKLPAMLEPIGWSYNGKGKVLDQDGNPVKNAHVQNISQDGTNEYRTWMSPYSLNDGTFSLPRLFPGNSILRVFFNNDKDSIDFPLKIEWNKPTNETVDLGKLVITNKATIEITPANMEGTEKVSYTWTANVSNGPENMKYEWNFGDGSTKETREKNNTITHTYNNANTYNIKVEVFNLDDGKSIGEATATAKIVKPSLNFTTVKVFIDFSSTSYHHIWWFENEKRWDTTGLTGDQLCNFAGYSDANRTYFPGVQGRKYKGSFSGTTFNGTCTGGSINLTISGDLKTVVSFSCTFTGESDLKNFVIQNSSAEGGGVPQTLFQADYKAEYMSSGGNALYSIVYVTNCKNATDNSFNQLIPKSSSVKTILIRLEN